MLNITTKQLLEVPLENFTRVCKGINSISHPGVLIEFTENRDKS